MKVRRNSWMTIVAGFGFAVAFAAHAQDAAKGDKALQGTWVADYKGKKFSIQFEKDNFTVRIDDDEVNGGVKLDPSKTPKTMDLTVTGGRGQPADRYSGKTALAIYQVDGDKLKWCANEPGKDERPQNFADDTGHLNMVLDREKK